MTKFFKLRARPFGAFNETLQYDEFHEKLFEFKLSPKFKELTKLILC